MKRVLFALAPLLIFLAFYVPVVIYGPLALGGALAFAIVCLIGYVAVEGIAENWPNAWIHQLAAARPIIFGLGLGSPCVVVLIAGANTLRAFFDTGNRDVLTLGSSAVLFSVLMTGLLLYKLLGYRIELDWAKYTDEIVASYEESVSLLGKTVDQWESTTDALRETTDAWQQTQEIARTAVEQTNAAIRLSYRAAGAILSAKDPDPTLIDRIEGLTQSIQTITQRMEATAGNSAALATLAAMKAETEGMKLGLQRLRERRPNGSRQRPPFNQGTIGACKKAKRLIEEGNMSQDDACREAKVDPKTYRRWRDAGSPEG